MFLLNSINLFLFIIDFLNAGIQLYMYTPIVGAAAAAVGIGRVTAIVAAAESFK
jgi:hypothetical protein